MIYQWYVSDTEAASDFGAEVEGATDATLEVSADSTPKYYYCVVSGVDSNGEYASVTSEKALVCLEEAPTLDGKIESDAVTMDKFDNNVDTYIIASSDDLVEFSNVVNSGITFEGKVVHLIKDISMANVANFTPIGTVSTPFMGTFYGNGHKISNLTISNGTTANTGLFGYVLDGTIKDLTIESGTITGGEGTGNDVDQRITDNDQHENQYDGNKGFQHAVAEALLDLFILSNKSHNCLLPS